MSDTTRDYIKLVSSDGQEFFIDRDCAMVSGTIRSMLDGPGNSLEQQQGEMTFRDINGNVLERAIQYFYYKTKYIDNPNAEVPEFTIEPEIALDLLKASNFLDC